MTPAQRINMEGAFRLVLQKQEREMRARDELRDVSAGMGTIYYPKKVAAARRGLDHACFELNASIEQFLDVLEQSLSPERVVQ